MSLDSLSLSQSTSNSLLDRAVLGESVAWQRIIQLYGPLVYGWARRYGLRPDDASDVTQETFTVVSQQLVRFDSERTGASFRGWLRMVCRNKAIDFFRNQSNRLEGRGGSTHQSIMLSIPTPVLQCDLAPDDVSENRERQQVILRAIETIRGSFERTTWQAFWRTSVDGVDPQSVAEELGMRRWAVYKCRSRVLHRLRTELLGLEKLT